MKRRRFLRALAASGILTPAQVLLASASDSRGGSINAGAHPGAGLDDIDPYFLDPGDMTSLDQRGVEELAEYHQLVLEGKDAFKPRSERLGRAPTYRFLHWHGEIGDPAGRFAGPLSIRPAVARSPAYRVNAQILGFNACSSDWQDETEKGALSIELRGRVQGEPMTWLFAQMFEIYKGGASSLGFEYVAQRDGSPIPIITDEPNIDIRIQLMRSKKAKSGVLGKVLRVASVVIGGPVGGATGELAGQLGGGQSEPAIRVPQMLKEGVALSQAVFAGSIDEKPIWRSGFASFGVGPGGSRMGLRPGLWVVMDESRYLDLRGAQIDDIGGRATVTRNGKPLDFNYLVLDFQVEESTLPDYLMTPMKDPEDEPWESPDAVPSDETGPGDEEAMPRGFIPRGDSLSKRPKE